MPEVEQVRAQLLCFRACIAIVRERFDNAIVQLAEHQGGCSTTLIVTSTQGEDDSIIQLRPVRYAVDADIVRAARSVYGKLVPVTELLQAAHIDGQPFQIVRMTRMPGVPCSLVMTKQVDLGCPQGQRLARLIEDLASVIARSLSWHRPEAAHGGRIGSSLSLRLFKLSRVLPDAALRRLALRALSRVDDGELDILPVVLTHGDLLPSNILIDPQSWRMVALVDWAEAEWLPFGMCLYGLEHLLGHLSDDTRTFVYLDEAPVMRAKFWSSLLEHAPALRAAPKLQAVHLARVIGILLWHGFAWDEGKIGRVINIRDDPSELAFLRAFLADDLLQISRL